MMMMMKASRKNAKFFPAHLSFNIGYSSPITIYCRKLCRESVTVKINSNYTTLKASRKHAKFVPYNRF